MARYTKVLKSLAHNAVGARRIEAASTGTTLPSQTGQAGKFLKTDGSNLSWATSSSANNFVDSVSVNIGTGIITLGRDGLSDLTSLTLSPLTTKGDLWVFGSANTRLPVGTNGYALVADSSTATGLNWAPNSDANYYTSSAAINSNIITGTVAGGGSNWSVDISGLTSVGTIATGVWSGTSIVDGKIASASNWNDAYNNYVASAAYSAGTLTFTQRDGGTFTATGFSQATGTVTGGGADNRIAHWTSATNVTGTSDLTYDGSKLILGSQGKVIVKYNDEDPKESTEILHVVTSGAEASFAIEALDNSSGVKNLGLISTLNANIKNVGQYWNTSGSPSYSDIYEWGYNGDASSANRNLYFKTVLAYPILFSTSNTERMRITSAGKVGIGTPAPAQTLDVRGTTLLSGATDTVPFEVFAYGAGTSALHVTSGSNTGIGTATPLAKLHINASAYQQVFQRDTHHMTIVKGNSDDRLIFATGAPGSHTTRFTINNTGIDVVNDAMITGSLTTTGVATLGNNSVTNTQTAGNNSTRIATTAFVTAAVAANTGTPGGSDTQVQYNNGGAFAGSSNMTFNGTNLTLASNLLLGSNLVHNGDTDTYIGFGTDTIDFQAGGKSFLTFTEVGTSGDTIVFNEGSNNIDFRIESDDNPNMFVMDAGNNTIGIGTAAPASNTLHIAGHGNPLRLQGTSSGKVEFGVSTSGDFTIDADDDIRLDAGGQDIALKGAGAEFGRLTNSSQDFVIQNTQNDKDIIFKTVDNTTATEVMRIDGSESRVGIGLDTPTSKLHVKGTLDIQDGNQTILMGAGNSSTSRSNDTLKLARVGLAHYHNGDLPVAMLYAASNGTDNTVVMGGGTSNMNAATRLQFATAVNDATTAGTVRASIQGDTNYDKLYLGADTTLGFWRYGNRMDFYVASQPRIHLDSGTLYASAATGSPSIDLTPTAGTATYGFYGDTDTGLDRTGADTLVLLTAGTARMTISSAGNATFTEAVTLGDNSVTNTQSLGNSTTRLATTEFVAAALTAGGYGNVSKVGTPANNQIGVWTGDGTIEGNNDFTYDAGTLDINDRLNIIAAGAAGTPNIFQPSQDGKEIQFRAYSSNLDIMRLTDAGDVGIGHTAALNGAKLTVLDATRPLVLAYDTSNYSSFDISNAGGLTITVPHSFVVDSSRHMDLDIGSVTREHRFLYAGTKYGYATTTDSNTFWTIASTSTPTAGMMLSGAAGSITLKPHDKDVDIYGAVQLVNGQVTSNPGTNHLWASGSTLFWGSNEIDTSADSGTIGGSISSGKLAIGTGTDTIGNFVDALTEDNSIYIGANPASTTSTAEYNLAIGKSAMSAVTTGDSNTAVGARALLDLTEGSTNTAVGYNAGENVTTGGSNTFIGYDAGKGADTESNNVALGAGALRAAANSWNTAIGVNAARVYTGHSIVALGYEAGSQNVSGGGNTILGNVAFYNHAAGASNTVIGSGSMLGDGTNKPSSSSNNTSIGVNTMKFASGSQSSVAIGNGALAGAANNTSNYTVAIGYKAASGTTGGDNNVVIGHESMMNVTTGHTNATLGYQAGYNVTEAIRSQFIGGEAGGSVTTAQYNTIMGYQAGHSLTVTGNNVLIGKYAGRELTKDFSTMVGINAGQNTSTGMNNTYIGASAAKNSSTGYYNVAVGNNAGNYLSGATGVVDIGYGAGFYVSGNGNVFIGLQAGMGDATQTLNTANYNVGIGYESMKDITSGFYNIAMGMNSLANITGGDYNVALGNQAGEQITTQNENTLVGNFAGQDLTGQYNVFLGSSAGFNATSADNNVAIGRQALGSATLTGDSNVAIGYTAGHTATSALANVLVGQGAGYGITTAQKSVVIGNNAGYAMATQGGSVIVGFEAGRFQDAGSGGSVAIGHQALYSGTQNYQDVAIGYNAGRKATGASSSNVFLGTHAGPSSTGVVQNKLYINNAEGTPLIGGDFSAGTVTINGIISATAKSFNIPHPLYKDKRLVHGSLEGPEHGIYIRGTIETEEKGCLVELPEYWSAMCEDYTVQLTPHGPYTVYIKEKLKDKVMIECSQKKFKFDYYIVGARTDETLEVVQDASSN